jgi:hypothetical protein
VKLDEENYFIKGHKNHYKVVALCIKEGGLYNFSSKPTCQQALAVEDNAKS